MEMTSPEMDMATCFERQKLSLRSSKQLLCFSNVANQREWFTKVWHKHERSTEKLHKWLSTGRNILFWTKEMAAKHKEYMNKYTITGKNLKPNSDLN